MNILSNTSRIAIELQLSEKEKFYEYIKNIVYNDLHNTEGAFMNPTYIAIVEAHLQRIADNAPIDIVSKRVVAKSLSEAPLYIPKYLTAVKSTHIAFSNDTDVSRSILELAEKIANIVPIHLHSEMFRYKRKPKLENVSPIKPANVIFYHIMQYNKNATSADKHKLKGVIEDINAMIDSKDIATPLSEVKSLHSKLKDIEQSINVARSKVEQKTIEIDSVSKTMRIIQSAIARIDDLPATSSIHVDVHPATKALRERKELRLQETKELLDRLITQSNSLNGQLRDYKSVAQDIVVMLQKPKENYGGNVLEIIQYIEEQLGLTFREKFKSLLKQNKTMF